MCYDISYFAPIQEIEKSIAIDEWPGIDYIPTYHQVAQSWHPFPVVFKEAGKNKLVYFEWGLIAPFMNTPEKIEEYRGNMANARSEKILGDPKSVWHRIRKQRCLVFTTGFFEHRDIGAKKKLPYFIRVKDKSVFCFAGLYHYANLPDAETGELKGTFTIVTRNGNPLLEKIHNSGAHKGRMPLILKEEMMELWLDPDLEDEKLQSILRYEFPESLLEAWPVHTIRIKKHDDVHVIEPLPESSAPAL